MSNIGWFECAEVRGVPDIWTPARIHTDLWLDAADNATVFSDAGITPAIAGSSTIQQWNDKSGNGRHVIQGTASARPAYSAAAINGKNSLLFTSDDFMQNTAPGLVTGAAARSLYVVYKPSVLNTAAHWVVGQSWDGTTTNSWFGIMYRNDAAKGDPYIATYAGDITDNTVPTLSAKIGTATYDGTTAILYRNGAVIASDARSLATNTGISFLIGRDGQLTSFMSGAVAEIIFIHHVLSQSDRQKIEGYLAHKWGLAK